MGRKPLEVWGGLECTIARVGDRYRDQVAETGHRDRIEDLDRIAALGIRTLRYPLLWEAVSPDSPREADFAWTDGRIARLSQLGIRPIAGLCHHGSGPRYTHLLDPAWPALLARHAARVAERYPHIDLYTPVNEPLTTARFSALYGHWYPHARSYGAFLRALVQQCKATVLAMRAVRSVRPDAGLVQTDDMGKTFSTPRLAYQAEHENERRWLAFDLLCGRVDLHHPWWGILRRHGIAEADLDLLVEGDAAPDIIGINHYLTSERYLDEAFEHYPDRHRGGNGRHDYADAEAVRVVFDAPDLGPAARLRETWERYRRPVAVTEVHHGCTRDEQLRWLVEVWNAAQAVRAEGADIHAVTIWSLFGTVDWHSLLTRDEGIFEPGPFDIRGAAPRRTALATAAESLARTGAYDHPVLDGPGWWRRESRLYRPPARASVPARQAGAARRLLVTGASGTLGRAFSRIADHRGLDHALLARAEMDIAEPDSVAAALARIRPWAVVNAAGYVRVADAEREPEACFRDNALGAQVLARACADSGIPLVTFSTDLVFDGRAGRAYVESDAVCPTGVYGASKAEAERRVAAAHPGALIVRTSTFFGPWDRYNFVWSVLRRLAHGESVEAEPGLVSPTYVPDLVHAVLDALIDGEAGIRHLANPGEISWHGFAEAAARRAGFDPAMVHPLAGAALNTALASERGAVLPRLESALDRFVRDSEVSFTPGEPMRIAAE